MCMGIQQCIWQFCRPVQPCTCIWHFESLVRDHLFLKDCLYGALFEPPPGLSLGAQVMSHDFLMLRPRMIGHVAFSIQFLHHVWPHFHTFYLFSHSQGLYCVDIYIYFFCHALFVSVRTQDSQSWVIDGNVESWTKLLFVCEHLNGDETEEGTSLIMLLCWAIDVSFIGSPMFLDLPGKVESLQWSVFTIVGTARGQRNAHARLEAMKDVLLYFLLQQTRLFVLSRYISWSPNWTRLEVLLFISLLLSFCSTNEFHFNQIRSQKRPQKWKWEFLFCRQ